MSKLLKIIALNLLIFFAIVQGILLIVSIVGDVWDHGKLALREGDKKGRYLLPAYEDNERARRIFEDQRRTVEGYSSFVGWRRQPLETETTNIGADGLRLHTLGQDNAPNSKTLGFFGGSAAWGTGVADDDTIPAKLDALTDHYEVTNYGETGWTSRQNLAQLINLMNEGKAPDIVIFYDGANDVAIHCNLGFGSALNVHHESRKLERLVLDSQSKSYFYRNFIVPAVDTFQRATGYVRNPSDWACDVDPDRAVAVANHLLRNWEIAHTLVESYGGEFIGILQPVSAVGEPRLDYLELDPGRLTNYAATYAQIRPLIQERDLEWVWDLTDTYDIDRPLYIDHVHVTGDGNGLVAARIAKILQAPEGAEP